MALKRAKFYSYGNDDLCMDVRKFIESGGILLEIHDLEKRPLSIVELEKLIGHLSVEHFINKLSVSYKKNRLDKVMPPRNEILKMMADDYTLIRKPIVQSSRLLTIGCDKKKIADMLQLSFDGDQDEANGTPKNQKVSQGASLR